MNSINQSFMPLFDLLKTGSDTTDLSKSLRSADLDPNATIPGLAKGDGNITQGEFGNAVSKFHKTDSYTRMTETERTNFDAKAAEITNTAWGDLGAKSVQSQVDFYKGHKGETFNGVTVTDNTIAQAQGGSNSPQSSGGFGADGYLPIVNASTGKVQENNPLDVDKDGILKADKDAAIKLENLGSTPATAKAAPAARPETEATARAGDGTSVASKAGTIAAGTALTIGMALQNYSAALQGKQLDPSQQKQFAQQIAHLVGKGEKADASPASSAKPEINFDEAYAAMKEGKASRDQQMAVLHELETQQKTNA